MGRKGGRGYGGGGRGRLYTYRYTVPTRITSALTWTVMRTISMFHNCEGQSHKTGSTDHNLFWRERRAKAVLNRGPFAYQPNALLLGQTGSHTNHGLNSPFCDTNLGANFPSVLTCQCDAERGLKRSALQQLSLHAQLEVRDLSHAASQEHILQHAGLLPDARSPTVGSGLLVH